VAADFLKEFFCSTILLTSLFASGGLGAGGFASVYQHIVIIHKNSFLSQFISRRQHTGLHPLTLPSR
jgi:hypothetical protein